MSPGLKKYFSFPIPIPIPRTDGFDGTEGIKRDRSQIHHSHGRYPNNSCIRVGKKTGWETMKARKVGDLNDIHGFEEIDDAKGHEGDCAA